MPMKFFQLRTNPFGLTLQAYKEEMFGTTTYFLLGVISSHIMIQVILILAFQLTVGMNVVIYARYIMPIATVVAVSLALFVRHVMLSSSLEEWCQKNYKFRRVFYPAYLDSLQKYLCNHYTEGSDEKNTFIAEELERIAKEYDEFEQEEQNYTHLHNNID